MDTRSTLYKSLSLPLLAAGLSLSGNADAVEFSISGQVNRLIMDVDNGEESGLVHADNSVSGTRWRIEGEGQLDNGMTAGLLYENQLQSNPSSEITAATLDSDGIGGNVGGGDYFSLRFATVWLKGDFGKVTLGQGSGAADGTTEADQSGTTVIQYVGSSADLLGSMEYGTSGVTVADARSAYDGLGRSDNIRYDAALGDLAFAGSIGNGDKVEISVTYVKDNLQLRAGLWDANDSGNEASGHAISASWLADSGLSLTGSVASDDSTGDPSNIYFKVGFRDGDSAYGFDWSETRDRAAGDAS
ncbi:MAG: porin, partial [Gammaproteobacteria bacterium]